MTQSLCSWCGRSVDAHSAEVECIPDHNLLDKHAAERRRLRAARAAMRRGVYRSKRRMKKQNHT